MQTVDASDDQVGSQDEYQISLVEGVDDETLLSRPVDEKNFSITSYGADYTVDSLVKRMKGGAFQIPEFQRRFVWSQTHASKFIESLLMGLPVPGIFLYKQPTTNQHLVIDGQQRLRTLQSFYGGLFAEKKFRLIGIRKPWAGKSYDELDASDQYKLDDSIVHATIFQQDKPDDVLDSIYFVFERINSGGIRLSPQEIRNCITAGPFIDMVKALNKNKEWRTVFGAPENKRAKDEELIVRFFGLYDNRSSYKRPMAKFLNDYAEKMNAPSEAGRRLELASVFEKTISAFDASVGSSVFRPVRSLNAAVFDSAMSGLAMRIDDKLRPAPTSASIKSVYDKLLADADYRRAWERATADEDNIKRRFDMAEAAFKEI